MTQKYYCVADYINYYKKSCRIIINTAYLINKGLIYYRNANVSYLTIESADQSNRFVAPTY